MVTRSAMSTQEYPRDLSTQEYPRDLATHVEWHNSDAANIGRLQSDIESKNEAIEGLRRTIADKEADIGALKSTITLQQQTISNIEAANRQLKALNVKLQEEIAGRGWE